MSLIDARLGNAKLPPGYRVVWSDAVEHYFWLCEHSERESVLTWDKWAAFRGAWADYRRAAPPHTEAP